MNYDYKPGDWQRANLLPCVSHMPFSVIGYSIIGRNGMWSSNAAIRAMDDIMNFIHIDLAMNINNLKEK
jgi:hypothetical protein